MTPKNPPGGAKYVFQLWTVGRGHIFEVGTSRIAAVEIGWGRREVDQAAGVAGRDVD